MNGNFKTCIPKSHHLYKCEMYKCEYDVSVNRGIFGGYIDHVLTEFKAHLPRPPGFLESLENHPIFAKSWK